MYIFLRPDMRFSALERFWTAEAKHDRLTSFLPVRLSVVKRKHDSRAALVFFYTKFSRVMQHHAFLAITRTESNHFKNFENNNNNKFQVPYPSSRFSFNRRSPTVARMLLDWLSCLRLFMWVVEMGKDVGYGRRLRLWPIGTGNRPCTITYNAPISCLHLIFDLCHFFPSQFLLVILPLDPLIALIPDTLLSGFAAGKSLRLLILTSGGVGRYWNRENGLSLDAKLNVKFITRYASEELHIWLRSRSINYPSIFLIHKNITIPAGLSLRLLGFFFSHAFTLNECTERILEVVGSAPVKFKLW